MGPVLLVGQDVSGEITLVSSQDGSCRPAPGGLGWGGGRLGAGAGVFSRDPVHSPGYKGCHAGPFCTWVVRAPDDVPALCR